MTDSAQPRPVEKLRGTVTRGIFGKGTKSEREAIFIETGAAKYLLRRKGGPALGDEALERYVGKTVECDGFLLEATLLAERITTPGAA